MTAKAPPARLRRDLLMIFEAADFVGSLWALPCAARPSILTS
jgi:hypothetical protein